MKHALCKDLYLCERGRREEIRQSVATPVAALAFSIFNLGNLSTQYDASAWPETVSLVIATLMLASVLILLLASLLIIKVERLIFYYDPPSLKDLTTVEKNIENKIGKNGNIEEEMQNYISACYDISYRKHFISNERAARDRTRGLHLIVLALMIIAIAYLFLPFQ